MKKLLFLAALTLCAAPAYAAPDRFEQMDKDGNGQVDWEEFQAAVPGMKRPAFDTIDADKSGGICRSEWDNFMKTHMGGQKGMPPAGMGMPAGMGGSHASRRSRKGRNAHDPAPRAAGRSPRHRTPEKLALKRNLAVS